MDIVQRLYMIRIITKIYNNPDFSKKIGVKNVSAFRTEKSFKESCNRKVNR